MRSRRSVAALSLLLASLCVTSSPSISQAQQASEAKDARHDMRGTWAQLQVTTGNAHIPVVGDVVSVTRALILLEIEQDGDDLTMKETICDIDITSSVKRVRTIVPQKFLTAASGQTRKGRVWVSGDTVSYEQAKHVVVLGAKLKDPKKDALPTDPDDARVIDQDRDGNPGMTVRVEGLVDGEIYIVQRGWNKLLGTRDGDRIDGMVRWDSTQEVLDSTSVLLGDSPRSRSTNKRAQNYFKNRKVPANTTCKTLKKTRKSVFR